jgi:hypothetical protein
MDPDRCLEVSEGPPFPNLELVSTSEGTWEKCDFFKCLTVFLGMELCFPYFERDL